MGVLKITRGLVKSAAKVVVYGQEGVGKSTLAADAPRPLILDTEDGTRHLNCDRVRCLDWQSLTLAVAELTVNNQGYQTVVVDSLDWAERSLIEWMLKSSGKKSIEDFGFGKGYTMLAEHVGRFLDACDKLVDTGVNVVLVAHSKVARTSPPDQTEGYDRYELKVTKQTAPLVKEWADALLFLTFKTRLVEGADGRVKATGGKSRVMYSERCAAWDAKNRYGLPEEMPLGIEALAAVFAGQGTAGPVGGAAAPRAKVKPESAQASPPDPEAGSSDRLVARAVIAIGRASTVAECDELRERIDARLVAGEITNAEAEALLASLDAKESEIRAKEEAADAVA